MPAPAKAPSSTSSSDAGGGRAALFRELALTAAVILAVVGSAELAFRVVVDDLSANSRTLVSWPERAERIRAHDTGPTVLVLGNSISGEGVDAAQLQTGLESAGVRALVEHQPADSSIARDWYYQLRNQYLAGDAAPDVLLLPVGDLHPLTQLAEETEDFVYYFLRFGDLAEYFAWADRTAFEDRAQIVVAKAVSLYAFRGRFQKRVLTALIPGYEGLWTRRADSDAPDAPTLSADWAERLDELADAHDIRVIVVAVPTDPLRGTLRAPAREVCERLGWTMLEPGAGERWTDDDVPDGLHLTPAAAERFTALLVPALADALADEAAQ